MLVLVCKQASMVTFCTCNGTYNNFDYHIHISASTVFVIWTFCAYFYEDAWYYSPRGCFQPQSNKIQLHLLLILVLALLLVPDLSVINPQ